MMKRLICFSFVIALGIAESVPRYRVVLKKNAPDGTCQNNSIDLTLICESSSVKQDLAKSWNNQTPLFELGNFKIEKDSLLRATTSAPKPTTPKPKPKDLVWLDATRETVRRLAQSHNLVAGGRDYNGKALYICRIVSKIGKLVVPGKVQLGTPCMVAGLRLADKREVEFFGQPFQVLANPFKLRLAWLAPNTYGPLGLPVFQGGYEYLPDGRNITFAIGRAEQQKWGSWVTTPGRVNVASRRMRYGFEYAIFESDRKYQQLTVVKGESVSEVKTSVKWIDASRGRLPQMDQLVKGGVDSDGHPQAVCRCSACGNGRQIPGRLDTRSGICTVAYGPQKNTLKSNYQVLTNPRGDTLIWVSAKDGAVPVNALPAGRGTPDYGPAYYIGRSWFANERLLGAVDTLNGGLFAGDKKNYRGRRSTTYEVLVVKQG